MNRASTVPCSQCQIALNRYDSIEYLYCGHHKIVAFRFEDGQIDFIAVNSTDEAVALTQESGQSALPLQVPA
jgi:hypothetical protein